MKRTRFRLLQVIPHKYLPFFQLPIEHTPVVDARVTSKYHNMLTIVSVIIEKKYRTLTETNEIKRTVNTNEMFIEYSAKLGGRLKFGLTSIKRLIE